MRFPGASGPRRGVGATAVGAWRDQLGGAERGGPWQARVPWTGRPRDQGTGGVQAKWRCDRHQLGL